MINFHSSNNKLKEIDKIKVLFITGNYLPEKNGGIENYVHWIAKLLLAQQINVQVAALNLKDQIDYIFDDVHVKYLNGSISKFESLLQHEEYDICHFHEYSTFGGIEIPWFLLARKYSKKVFFTFHLPYLTCYKSDFRYKGIEDCNNFSSPERCLKCIIATKMNYKKNASLNFQNKIINAAIPFIKMFPQITKIRGNIKLRRNELDKLINICDKVFVIADWFKNILEINGIDSAGIKKVPPFFKITSPTTFKIKPVIKNKILFAGRIEKQKGLHLLCKAMNRIGVDNIKLDVFGNIVNENYYKECERLYAFNYKGVVSRIELLGQLTNYDFLILPSVCTEMYSMILQEALYELLPVIASNSKGNSAMIKDGTNGFLFDYNNAEDLALTIDKAYNYISKGWQPQFTNIENTNRDITEIVSYYC